jgi:hypothetical protein
MAARKLLPLMAFAGIVVGVISAAAIAGCGSGSGSKATGSSIQVQINAPSSGSVISADRTTVRGTVNPPTASVQIVGQQAQVGNGVFTGSVALHPGANTIDVTASAPGFAPTTTTVSVTRPQGTTPRPQGSSSNGAGRSGGTPAPARSSPPSGGPSGGTPCGGGLYAGPNTSCSFAQNVKAAYDNTGGGTVSVYSPTTGRTYSMSCTSSPPHVCTGANNASVYFP